TLTLKVSAAGKTVEVPLTIQLRESSAATIIEPSQSRLLDLNPPADSGPTERVLSHYFKDPISIDLDKASCTIPIESNDFRTKRSTAEIPVQCKELSGFIREINDRVVSTNQKHSMRWRGSENTLEKLFLCPAPPQDSMDDWRYCPVPVPPHPTERSTPAEPLHFAERGNWSRRSPSP